MGLFDNPFYILGASPRDTRRVLVEKTEARLLVMEESVVREAYHALTDPVKRLVAELEWFPEFEDDRIAEFLAHAPNSMTSVDSVLYTDLPIHTTAPLLLFLEWTYQNTSADPQMFVDIVLRLGSGYCGINRTALIDTINAHRREAGFGLISSVQEIDNAFQTIRFAIKTELARHAKSLSWNQHIEAVRQLAERYDSSDPYAGGSIVIRDVIDSYALTIDTYMRAQSDHIMDRIRLCLLPSLTKDRVFPELKGIFQDLAQWNYVVHPLQLRENHQGRTHHETEHIVFEARNLCFALQFSKDLREEALFINDQLRAMYARFPVFSELLNEDLRLLDPSRQRMAEDQGDLSGPQEQSSQVRSDRPSPSSSYHQREKSFWEAMGDVMATVGGIFVGFFILMALVSLLAPSSHTNGQKSYSPQPVSLISQPYRIRPPHSSPIPPPTLTPYQGDLEFQEDKPALKRALLISYPPMKETMPPLSPELTKSLDPEDAEEVTALWQELNTLSPDISILERSWYDMKCEINRCSWEYSSTEDESYLDLINSICDECEPVYDEYVQALEHYNELAMKYKSLLRQTPLYHKFS